MPSAGACRGGEMGTDSSAPDPASAGFFMPITPIFPSAAFYAKVKLNLDILSNAC